MELTMIGDKGLMVIIRTMILGKDLMQKLEDLTTEP